MDKILSQDEINALFSSMSSGDNALEESADAQAPAQRSCTKFNFCRSDRISKDQVRSIHLLHTFFARNLSSSLSAYLRALVEVNLASVNQLSYMEFLKLLSDPTLCCSVAMKPMAGSIALEFSPSVVYPMIDMLLGGPGSPAPENRTLTEIEMNIVEGILNLALRDLKNAWKPVMDVSPQLEGRETRPQMLQIVAPGEAVVAIGFEVKLGEHTGMLNVCIPSVMLKVNRGKFGQQRRPKHSQSDGKGASKIQELLRSAPVGVAGEIRGNGLRVGDLLRISKGDVIQLKQTLDDALLLTVGGIPKFWGKITVRRGKKVFEISRKYEP